MPQIPWLSLHGAITHFPIALLITALAFDIGAIFFKKPEWRIVSFWMLVISVIASIPALMTGWITAGSMYAGAAEMPSMIATHRIAAFASSGLASLLLVWRVKKRNHEGEKPLVGPLILSLLAVATVAYTGYLGGESLLASISGGNVPLPPPVVSSPPPKLDPTQVRAGAQLFDQLGCRSCHMMDGRGGSAGPNLTQEGRRGRDLAWQVGHLKTPDKFKPGSTMPAYNSQSDTDLKALAQYLDSKR